MGTIMIAGRGGSVERAIRRDTKCSGSVSDWKFNVEGATVERVGIKRSNRIEITQHWESENGVNGDIRVQTKGNSDRGTGHIGIQGVISGREWQPFGVCRGTVGWTDWVVRS